jgi:hypothetical protein
MEVRKILRVLLLCTTYVPSLGTHGSQENSGSVVVRVRIYHLSGNSWKSGKFWECCCCAQHMFHLWEQDEVAKIFGVLLLCTTYVPSLGVGGDITQKRGASEVGCSPFWFRILGQSYIHALSLVSLGGGVGRVGLVRRCNM